MNSPHPPDPVIPPTTLDAADLTQIVDALPELYRALDMTTFPRASLRLLNRLIPKATFSSYNEIDMKTPAARVFIEPEPITEAVERGKPGLWKHRAQHPIMRKYERGEHDGVWKISDFLTAPELHELDIYREVLGIVGVEDTLAFTLRSSTNLKVFYAINGPHPFTERDRAVAVLLQPHFVQAFENAVAFTDAQALALLSARSMVDAGEHGMMLIDLRGRIVHATERAGSHLAEAFPTESGETVPRLLWQWLQRSEAAAGQPRFPCEVSQTGVTFSFRSARPDAEHWLIATRRTEEAHLCSSLESAYQLTDRQAGVLLWLARGKTNDEIATILELSGRTVAKHLQRIFERLDVENRHAATMKVIELLGST